MPYSNPDGTPIGLYQGVEATPVQSYSEINSKKGEQQYLQLALPVTANSTVKIAFTTGSKPVIVKQRDFAARGEQISIQVFKSPTGVTGGSAVSIYNFNDRNPVLSTSQVLSGVTTSTNGISWGDPQTLYGTNQQNQRVTQFISNGSERILAANKTYLIVITNGAGDSTFEYFLSFREVMIKLTSDKLNPHPFTVSVGDRIAQAMIIPVTQVSFCESESLSVTDRGSKGFGSTGV